MAIRRWAVFAGVTEALNEKEKDRVDRCRCAPPLPMVVQVVVRSVFGVQLGGVMAKSTGITIKCEEELLRQKASQREGVKGRREGDLLRQMMVGELHAWGRSRQHGNFSAVYCCTRLVNVT